MRSVLTLAMLLAAAALLSGCAAFGPDLTSAVPPGLTAADAAPIAAAMTDLATRRLPAEAGAIRVDAPAGDAVLTPALTSDLRGAGYTVAGDGPHRLTDDVKADLRAHAAQALAKREAESGPVKVPSAKAARKAEQKPEQMRAKADAEQQPRMSVG